MSLQAIALELYNLEQRVEQLTRIIDQAGPAQPEDIERELLHARAQRDHLRAVLQAKKEPVLGHARPSARTMFRGRHFSGG